MTSDSPFDGLKGIAPPRSIAEPSSGVLAELVALADTTVERYASKFDSGKLVDMPIEAYKEEVYDKVYAPLYDELAASLPDYTAQNLQDMLLARGMFYDTTSAAPARAFGALTGVLLQVLTERHQQKKMPADFIFDLDHNPVHFLFYLARRVGSVTVRNVNGHHTCDTIAAFGGTAEKIILENIEGNYTATGAGQAGDIGLLAITRPHSDNMFTASQVGHNHGHVSMLVITGSAEHYVASRAGAHHGHVETIIIRDGKGDYAAYEAGRDEGRVETIVFKDYTGDYPADTYGSLPKYSIGHLKTLAFYPHVGGRLTTTAQNIITGKPALKLYKKLMRDAHV